MERLARIELANKPWQGFRLPLHHSRIKILVESTKSFGPIRNMWLPGVYSSALFV